MQKITFLNNGVVVAAATGQFEELPGSGPVSWSGPWVDNPPAIFTRGLPPYGYSGQFLDAMKGIAEELNLDSEIEESGDWQVFYE